MIVGDTWAQNSASLKTKYILSKFFEKKTFELSRFEKNQMIQLGAVSIIIIIGIGWFQVFLPSYKMWHFQEKKKTCMKIWLEVEHWFELHPLKMNKEGFIFVKILLVTSDKSDVT